MNNTIEENNIKALCKGDQRAFEVLFLYYQPKLVYFLTGFIKDSELARDMAQDIFMNVWNNKTKLIEIKSFKAYIFKMGKNAICNYYDHSLVNEKFVAEQLTRPVNFENTEEFIFAQQLQNLIDLTVCQMPSRRKLIYTMSRIEGFSNNEIAEELNINKRTVENHLTAALADIRKTIKKICMLFF
ncbi:MAG: RNA polymerase sigma-70 factor [Bacteroidales bacterium]